MIDVRKVRFAFGDTVSIAWMPVGMGVKVAITARSKSDAHNKQQAKNNLLNRLEHSEDPRFVFHLNEANARRIRNPNPNLLKFQTILNACLHAHNKFNMPYARKFVQEKSTPSQTFLNPPWFDVGQISTKKITISPELKFKLENPYTKHGLKVYFMHDVQNRYSMGWTYNPKEETVWFAVSACHENDAFNRNDARENILGRLGVKFRVRIEGDVKVGYNDFLRLISRVVSQHAMGTIQHPELDRELNRLPSRVRRQILDLPKSIELRKTPYSLDGLDWFERSRQGAT